MNSTLKTFPYLLTLLTSAITSCGVYAENYSDFSPTKNIIFFLGDGMGPTTVTASRIYAVGENGKLAMDTMKHAARIKTYSEDGQTTDSAPSMGAYMTGQKNKNEVIAMSTGTVAVEPDDGTLPNGKSLAKAVNRCPEQGSSVAAGIPALSILELAKSKGKAVGVVTTTELTHATPAATYAHICHRDAQYDIALQAVPKGKGYNPKLLDGINVLMGGGLNHWTVYDDVSNPKGRLDGRDLRAELKQQGYQTASTQNELAQTVNNQKIFAVFSAQSHLNYDLDRVNKKFDSQPSLAIMTSKAIDALEAQNQGQGYFLMVEGGRIDHALHGNNAKRALQEAKAFNDAIQTALHQVDISNTLIVVTADHDHVMTFNGYAARTGRSTADNPGILGLSYDYNVAKEQNAYSKVLADGQMHNPYRDVNGATGTTLVFGNGTGPRLDIRESISNEQAFADDYKQEVGVQLEKSETHGGGDVMLFAEGQNSNLFKGTRENTWVFEQLKKAFGF